MKKIGFATVVTSGLAAAILGLAVPARAVSAANVPPVLASAPEIKIGIDHHVWLDQIRPHVNVPQVDTGVRANPSAQHGR